MTDTHQPTPNTEIHTDLLIFGGGIAGLYLLKLLNNLGYDCVLIENNTLGGGQTLQSQGIIHGGLKYALGGNLNSESDAIKDMPERWRKLLNNEDTVKLGNTHVIAKTQHMWSTGKFASKFTSFFASKLLRGRIEKLRKDHMPAVFQAPQFSGNVYKLTDLVVDTPSLLQDLCDGVEHRILKGNVTAFEQSGQGIAASTIALANGSALTIRHRGAIFSAGAGNEQLTDMAGIQGAPMQRRPLHMVMVKHNLPYPLFAHGIGNGSKPRITITSHKTEDNQLVWYLGGDIAETGVDRDQTNQIAEGKKELTTLFPWLDFSDAQWSTFRIDRAEPLQQGLNKPDCAHTHLEKNIIVTWPTKLTLAPDLGDRVISLIEQQGIEPTSHNTDFSAFPNAVIATPKWESLF